MWQTMIKPLFNAALVLLEYEPSLTQKEDLEITWRGTFKQFMLISGSTPTELVNQMINCNLQEKASFLVEQCKVQWEERKNFQKLNSKQKLPKKPNLLRGVSNKFCEIINFQCGLCKFCEDQTSSRHLREKHGIQIKDILKIWEEDICPITNVKGDTSRKSSK